MPVSFLSESQKQHYGGYVGEPTAVQLAQYFHLDDTDQTHLARRRGLHNRLGFAVQLGTVRFLGTFLPDPTAVSAGVVRYLAQQLRIADPSCLTRYRTSDQRWEHTAEIRRVYGYTDFLIPRVQFRLQRWLYALCWTGTDSPSVLFERATTWRLSHKVLLPGVSVLERLVARLRPRVEVRVARVLTRGLSPAPQTQLTTLFHVPPGSRASTFERLRRGPIRQSVPALRSALRRVEEVRTLGLTVPSAGRVPPARLQTLARFATTTRMTALQRLPVLRQLATLVAFLHTLEATAQDDVLDLVDRLLTDLFTEAVSTGHKARLRTLKDLDVAADRLRHACAVLFDATLSEGQVRTAAFAAVPRETLADAIHQVDRLVRPPDEVYYPELQASYRRVRRFFPHLLRTITFAASPAGQAVVDALDYLMQGEAPQRQPPLDPPLAVVTPRWRRYVVRTDDTVAPHAYTFCVLDRLRAALWRRELFVTPSVRYAGPRRGLLEGAAWATARPLVCRALGQPSTGEEAMTTLRQQLDQTYRTVAARLPHNPAVRIETRRGKERLVLSPMEKLEEPPSLVALRAAVAARAPPRGLAGALTGDHRPHRVCDGLYPCE